MQTHHNTHYSASYIFVLLPTYILSLIIAVIKCQKQFWHESSFIEFPLIPQICNFYIYILLLLCRRIFIFLPCLFVLLPFFLLNCLSTFFYIMSFKFSSACHFFVWIKIGVHICLSVKKHELQNIIWRECVCKFLNKKIFARL